MAVSRQQLRRLAHRMDADTSEPARLGIQLAVAVANRMLTDVVRAYRRGEDTTRPMLDRIDDLAGIAADAMTLSHLRGVTRGRAMQTLQLDSRSRMRDLLRRSAAALQFSSAVVTATREWHLQSAAILSTSATNMLVRRVQGAILRAQSEGMHVRSGINEIRRAFEASGFHPRNKFTLESTFRTATNLAYSAGQYQTASDPAVAEDHWGWTYVTVGDERVRPTHEPLDGMTLPKDDARWDTMFPPNGHACRCKAIMLFDEGEVVEPPVTAEVDGETVRPGPDPGFDFHPGRVTLDGVLAPSIGVTP